MRSESGCRIASRRGHWHDGRYSNGTDEPLPGMRPAPYNWFASSHIHRGLPPKAIMEIPVAESELRRIVLDLKSQRRQIDRAIAALEAVTIGTQRHEPKAVATKQAQQRSPSERANGTTGQVVTFARRLKSGSG